MKRVLAKLALCVGVIVLFGCFQHPAYADEIILTNDVEISMSNVQPCSQVGVGIVPCPTPISTVVGAPRLLTNASQLGNAVQIAVTANSSINQLNFLGLRVFDAATLQPVFVIDPTTGQLQQLELVFVSSFVDNFQPVTFNLGQAVNFNLLPGNLDVAITVHAVFHASRQDPVPTAIIAVSGAGTVIPEPASVILLATGIAGVFGVVARKRNS